ncbi:MAG: SipW-dependent-type signal peptide-containing protein [Aeromicrobium sp.]
MLAGALVLGIGGSLTMAAWTDDEYASAAFASSRFVVESRTASSAWTSHEEGSPAALAFSATAMSPSTSYFAHVDVRTTAATTVGGTVALEKTSSAAGPLLPALEYRVVPISATVTCAAAAFAGQPYVAISLTSVPSASAALLASSASTARFCFEVRIKSGSSGDTYQGTTAAVTWQFAATSSS